MAKSALPDAAATRAAFRRVIRELINCLCAVPKAVRREWLDELFANGTGVDTVPPDDFVVRAVLSNLDVFESVANKQRGEVEKTAAKLSPLARKPRGGADRSRRKGAGGAPAAG